MTTFGERLGVTAERLVTKFAKEIGESTVSHLVGDVYDPATGVNVPSYSSHVCLVAFDELSSGEKYDEAYVFDHGLSIIAGGHISITPSGGDMITTPEGTTRKIVYVESDMYGDAYMCHYQKAPQ